MRVRFLGELRCPRWVSVELQKLSVMSLNEFKSLGHQVSKAITITEDGREILDFIKLEKLCFIEKFEWKEVKTTAEAFLFILSSASECGLRVDEIADEIQQLGLPKEHATALKKVYVDYAITPRNQSKKKEEYGIVEHRVYVGRFSDNVTKKDLAKFFEGFGPTKDLRRMTRFGFVEFLTREDAEFAVLNLNGQYLKGTRDLLLFPLYCNFSRYL